jgi:hypothetical protein
MSVRHVAVFVKSKDQLESMQWRHLLPHSSLRGIPITVGRGWASSSGGLHVTLRPHCTLPDLAQAQGCVHLLHARVEASL